MVVLIIVKNGKDNGNIITQEKKVVIVPMEITPVEIVTDASLQQQLKAPPPNNKNNYNDDDDDDDDDDNDDDDDSNDNNDNDDDDDDDTPLSTENKH